MDQLGLFLKKSLFNNTFTSWYSIFHVFYRKFTQKAWKHRKLVKQLKLLDNKKKSMTYAKEFSKSNKEKNSQGNLCHKNHGLWRKFGQRWKGNFQSNQELNLKESLWNQQKKETNSGNMWNCWLHWYSSDSCSVLNYGHMLNHMPYLWSNDLSPL